MQPSIIGAAGTVGRCLATHLLRGEVLTAADRLQPVGHGVEGTERRLLAERIRDAFDAVEALPSDIRVVLEPFVAAHCLYSSPNATANATCDVIRALRRGRESVVGAQVRLAGEFLDLHSIIGFPVLVNAAGWSQVICPPLASDEAEQLTAAAATITTNLAQWLH
jgi:malate dehydrogenase